MAEDKKTFLQGKMNQDIDDRILPNGEYRSAQNIQVTTSEGSDVGSIQNITGNSKVKNIEIQNYDGLETIGSFFDEKNNRIFYFVTNYTCPNSSDIGLVGDGSGPKTAEQQDVEGLTSLNPNQLFCGIFMANNAGGVSMPEVTTLVSGLYLNFSKTHIITGVNLLNDLLFWTDGLNQPRKININKELGYYDNEDKISVAKFAPFMPPLLLDYDTTTLNGNTPTVLEPVSSMELSSENDFPEDFLREKFVRFSYRYRFTDGEYSTIAPFTQVCFIPKTTSYNITELQKVFKKGEVYFQDTNGIADGMVNNVTAINLNIILPSKKINTDFDIEAIEILFKESDNNLIKAIELKELKDLQSETGVFQYKYKSTLPYKTLPEDQTTRVFDNVPLSAKAQEVVSNRVIYGNYVENRTLPNQASGSAGLNFSVGSQAKYDIDNFAGNADFNNYYLHKEYPFHSVKQRRTYEVGVVLADKFGRQSPVLPSTLGTSSIEVKAKDNNFHSSSWDNIGIISNHSPGNENYCGDALTITFNETIPNAYGKGKFIGINNNGDFLIYENDVFKTIFATNPLLYEVSQAPNATGQIIGELYYYSSTGTPNATDTEYFYTDEAFQNVLTGYSEIYCRLDLDVSASNTTTINKITLNPTTGAVVSFSTVQQSVFQGNLMGGQTPTAVAIANGSVNTTVPTMTVTPFQEAVTRPGFGLVYEVLITDFTTPSDFAVGDYLKGQNTDFVKIIGIEDTSVNYPAFVGIVLYCEEPASLLYKNYTGTLDPFNVTFTSPATYGFFKYNIVPHGWYSYRVVVKQAEQEYYNVYAPNIITFDNDRDQDKTYIPIVGDSINKITRDIEFTNTQEVGLSTSKNRIYPKVVPQSGDVARSTQDDSDLLDVISIGTSKEQGLKNDNEDTLAFIYETDKNPLVAQIPYGRDSINIGYNVTSGFNGNSRLVSKHGGDDIKLTDQGKTLHWHDNVTPSSDYISAFKPGVYLKGKNKDLVKIIAFEQDNNHFDLKCDGQIDEVALGLDDTNPPDQITVNYYQYKYNAQDRISVFETKPFESVLDIYYETSTAGLVHELNEAVSIPSITKEINLLDIDFSEGTQYFEDESPNSPFLNQYVARLQLLDQFDNELSQGTATNQIQSCIIVSQEGVMHDTIGGTIEVDRFEIVLDEDYNQYKIKPKQGTGNFVYYPDQFPIKYNFIIRITNVDGISTDIEVNNLELENLKPNVTSPNSFSTIGSIGEYAYEIKADNGSIIDDSNALSQLGLIYQDASLGENQGIEGVIIGFNSDLEPILNLEGDTSEFENGLYIQDINYKQLLFNAENGNVIPELLLDDQGRITLTELFKGYIDFNIEILVIDSNDQGIIQTGVESNALVGGKSTLHNLRLQVSTGLIVIENEDFDTVSSNLVYNGTENVDIFNQLGQVYQGTEVGQQSNFNSYWSQNPSQEQIEAGMPNMPASEVGTFLFSYDRIVSNTQGAISTVNINRKLYALLIDQNDQPIVKEYNEWLSIDSAYSNVNSKTYVNHWLAENSNGIYIMNSSQPQDSVLNNDDDIDGDDSDLILVPDNTLWDQNTHGNHEQWGGTPSDSTGSFKVYGNGEDVSIRLSKPKERYEQYDAFIVKTKDKVIIGEIAYNVLIEVNEAQYEIVGGAGINLTYIQTLQRVFLCRDLN